MCFHHLILIAVIEVTGCAPAPARPQPVNVALTRHEIERALAADRKIVSMGHVTQSEATVFTDPRDGTAHRRQETWVHGPDGWKMSEAKDLDTTN